MSHQVNDELLDRAAEMVSYWEGSLHADLIRRALDEHDLEAVRFHTLEAEAEASRQEMYGADVL